MKSPAQGWSLAGLVVPPMLRRMLTRTVVERTRFAKVILHERAGENLWRPERQE